MALRGRKTCIPQANGLRGEEDPALAEVFCDDLVLGAEELDDFMLLAVASPGEDGEQELPRLQNEVQG